MDQDIVCVSGIYAITNTVNGKRYVGSAVNLSKRWWKHLAQLRSKKHHSTKLQNSWNKHGEKAFKFTVLEYVKDLRQLIASEQTHIDAAHAVANGYNVCPRAGSRMGTTVSEETREKLSKAGKGRKRPPMTDATRDRLRQAMLGRKPSKEAIEKGRASRIGRKFPPEFGAAISARNKGIKFSAEHCAKLSAWQIGTTQSEETRKKRSESLKGRPRPKEVMLRIFETKAKNRAAKLALLSKCTQEEN